jgi:hypothetical protein
MLLHDLLHLFGTPHRINMRDKPALFFIDIPFSRSCHGFIHVVHPTKIVKAIEKV